MRHTITNKELLEYKQKEKVLFASSSKEQKRLYIHLSGYFSVEKDRKVVFETDQSHLAVQKYNEL